MSGSGAATKRPGGRARVLLPRPAMTTNPRDLARGLRAAAALLLVLACARETPASGDDPPASGAASGDRAASRDGAPRGGRADASGAHPIRTGHDTYAFTRDGDWERTRIDFGYDNGGPDTLYQATCRANGVGDPGLSMAVQRRVEDRWETAWVPILLACLSEPIVVPPGSTYRDTLEVTLHPQDSTLQPLLNTEVDIEGTYRLLWQGLLRSYDAESYPFGEEVAESLRVSNAFRLER